MGDNTNLLDTVGENTKLDDMVGENTNGAEVFEPLEEQLDLGLPAAPALDQLLPATRPSSIDHLLPERYPQHDLFICDVADAALKDVMQLMEHPFYSLSKKPETAIRRYEHNGNVLEITPSVKGLATIYDKDILIYCISQLIGALKRGEKISQRVRINSRDLLMFTNRGTSGREYLSLKEGLDRLAGTRIVTNIRTGDEEQIEGFGLIDTFGMKRKNGPDGRLLWCDVKLSDWVFKAIRNYEVLTLHRDYFRLRKPIERRIYELARKHCGQQQEIEFLVETLYTKSGSRSDLKEFRRAIRELARGNHLPDYLVNFDEVTDKVHFINRSAASRQAMQKWQGHLPAEALNEARNAAPGWDIYHLEQEWRVWLLGKTTPRNPAKHFLKFCQTWFAKRGPA